MRAVVLVLLLSGCASPYFRDAGAPPAPQAVSIAQWPHKEIWTGVVFNGDKIGFTRRTLRPAAGAPGLYEIESEAAIRLRFLGIDKRVNLRALDRVREDLTLVSFRYEHEIDGSPLKVSGSADGAKLKLTVEASGSREESAIPLSEPLYPSSAMSYLPVLRGLAVGRSARFAVFEGETQKLAEAEQEVLAWESSKLFEGPAFKLMTRLMGMETTTWISADGRPVLEVALNGVLISGLEDEASARRYLVEASLNKRDSMVEFSLLRAGPLAAPRAATRMEIVLAGVPAGFELPSEGGQACRDSRCVIDRAAPLAQGNPANYLKATMAAPSNLGEIRDLSAKISGAGGSETEKIGRILSWMDDNIAKEAIDSFTAIDVLRERRAECQGHAYLFAALARAAGIPTRVVNGLVYSAEHGGFLYHTWNEAWIAERGWRPVDATFGQPHADATHLKLLEGEQTGDLVPLVGLVGRIKVVSVSAGER
ncbi:MAG TPA: transglutaminase-like domain-containing protein [Burkholderiales bacterium]|nr:transglutaminase-like domain-containing protein [Burkholderiales bacterium]